jgi:hypothetical protein
MIRRGGNTADILQSRLKGLSFPKHQTSNKNPKRNFKIDPSGINILYVYAIGVPAHHSKTLMVL